MPSGENSACKKYFCFFQYVMSGKGRMAYNKAPTKEEVRKWGSLSRKGDKIKFADVRIRKHRTPTITCFKKPERLSLVPQLPYLHFAVNENFKNL